MPATVWVDVDAVLGLRVFMWLHSDVVGGGFGAWASFVSVNSFVAYLAFRVDLGLPFVRCEGT